MRSAKPPAPADNPTSSDDITRVALWVSSVRERASALRGPNVPSAPNNPTSRDETTRGVA